MTDPSSSPTGSWLLAVGSSLVAVGVPKILIDHFWDKHPWITLALILIWAAIFVVVGFALNIWKKLSSKWADRAANWLDMCLARESQIDDSQADAEVAAYREWLAHRHRHLKLIGVGAGDFKLSLDKVYVPLRIERRGPEMGRQPGLEEARWGRGSGELELEDIFRLRREGCPHAVLLGDPGAGKTTALLKLLHLCLTDGPRSLGLPSGTLPVFFRLRWLTPGDLDQPFSDLLARELEKATAESSRTSSRPEKAARRKLVRSFAPKLWADRPLLLLLDGLDEIADPELRAQVAKKITWELSQPESSRVRALISSRHSGYGGDVRLEDFLHLEVRPLDGDQCLQLVEHWFAEAERSVPNCSGREAREAVESLKTALSDPQFASQRLKVLVGSPLLLTLLCVVVLRGNEMPRRRGAFYEQCLRVLLSQWSQHARGQKLLVDSDTAFAVLRPLAYRFHAQGITEQAAPKMVRELRGRLQALGQTTTPYDLIRWLRREAGVLAEFAPNHYGFSHLGLQEYLVALHIASQGEALLDEVCERFGNRFWEEAVLLLFGLPGCPMLGPLITKLLESKTFLEHSDLLRRCLEEIPEEVDVGPFLPALEPGQDADRQAVVLRLLRAHSNSRVVASARELLRSSPRPDVKALAEQIVEEAGERTAATRASRRESYDFFLLHHASDREACDELAVVLRGQQLSLYELTEGESWQDLRHLESILENTRSVLLVAGPGSSSPWGDEAVSDLLSECVDCDRPVIPVLLPGNETVTELPAELGDDAAWVDFRESLQVEKLYEAMPARLATGLMVKTDGATSRPPAAAAARGVADNVAGPRSGHAWKEPVTGIHLLWIPEGSFRMGRQGLAEPVHEVAISGFWLSETPITNQRYGRFLEASGAKEPAYWRDRRFSDPEQPVVGVDWEEARVFCRWFAELTGLSVDLPSEAQWEYAARGTESLEYPWGGEEPDESRACFGLDWEKDQPVAVGSYPAGKGPFGTLDQAGNVWEWCLDVWNEAAYQRRAGGTTSRDPFVEEGDSDLRVIRGSAFGNPAEDLRAALRFRNPARNRLVGISFRVAASPASL